jgi:hypothetical protein
MQHNSALSATMKVAEFKNMETAEHFDSTVSETSDGKFAIDEHVVSITGPFFVFADGVIGIFKGLHDRKVLRATA